jgi:hypothetical protein
LSLDGDIWKRRSTDMSQAAVESFLGRIITDANFGLQATRSLESACRNAGLTISSEELMYLKMIDLSQLVLMADGLNDSIKRG